MYRLIRNVLQYFVDYLFVSGVIFLNSEKDRFKYNDPAQLIPECKQFFVYKIMYRWARWHITFRDHPIPLMTSTQDPAPIIP
jgi:hypothetical protein